MLVSTMRRTLTPDAVAALSERPVARRSKPNRVRLRVNWNATPTITAITMKPQSVPPAVSIEKKWLEADTGSVWMLLVVVPFCGAKMPGTSSRPTTALAMAFSMMVEMTSLTPR